jgi:hypothetical protein
LSLTYFSKWIWMNYAIGTAKRLSLFKVSAHCKKW